MKRILLAGLLSILVSSASAQTIYRCGNNYSSVPCANGKALEATAPGTAAQRAEGSRVAAAERRLAAQMRRDRLAEEAAIKPAAATSLSGSAKRPADSASAAKRTHSSKKGRAEKAEKTTDFVAQEPRSAASKPSTKK